MISSILNMWRKRKLRLCATLDNVFRTRTFLAAAQLSSARLLWCSPQMLPIQVSARAVRAVTAEVSNNDYVALVKLAKKPSLLAFQLMPFDVNHLSHHECPPPPPHPPPPHPPDNQQILMTLVPMKSSVWSNGCTEEHQRTMAAPENRTCMQLVAQSVNAVEHEWGSLVCKANAVPLDHHAYARHSSSVVTWSWCGSWMKPISSATAQHVELTTVWSCWDTTPTSKDANNVENLGFQIRPTALDDRTETPCFHVILSQAEKPWILAFTLCEYDKRGASSATNWAEALRQLMFSPARCHSPTPSMTAASAPVAAFPGVIQRIVIHLQDVSWFKEKNRNELAHFSD